MAYQRQIKPTAEERQKFLKYMKNRDLYRATGNREVARAVAFGISYLEDGNNEEALRFFITAEAPFRRGECNAIADHYRVCINMSIALGRLGRHDEAVDFMHKAEDLFVMAERREA
ncbi:MAG: hypothetical protein MPL62_18215 [Alphaproteobacteria bacterium]|nr:hypothetical protein [Alphaproteobacteria bacterium]